MTERVIALIDMDCFYCQVESRENPDLKGKPSAVVQYNAWKGGGIIAVNYEARDFGVTRNMRGDDAKAKCPDVVLVKVPEVRGKADLTKYRNAGKEVIQVLLQFGAIVERASIDEAYIDLTALVDEKMNAMKITHEDLPNSFVIGSEESKEAWLNEVFNEENLRSDDVRLAIGAKIVEDMRAEVFKQTQFRCSAGIAHNKVLAKLTCGIHKPNKQTVLPQNQVASLFQKIKVGKVRGLGGKLGDVVTEELNCKTMADLSTLSLIELRRHFDEKTTNWLYNIAKGIDHEEVKERDLPKSIGCGKNFRGPEMLDTREKVEKWMGTLCEELSERLYRDQDENGRVAKSLHVGIIQENSGQMSRSGPLYSYDPGKIASQALLLIAKTNELPSTDANWRPKLKNMSISASKFDENAASAHTQSITTFFNKADKMKTPATTIVDDDDSSSVSVKEAVPKHDDLQIPDETDEATPEGVESAIEAKPVIPAEEPEIELVKCEKCSQNISPFELPEHLDYHMAKELQDQLRRENMGPAPSGQSNFGSNKRKGQAVQKVADAKKQKTIASFFAKK